MQHVDTDLFQMQLECISQYKYGKYMSRMSLKQQQCYTATLSNYSIFNS